jgi:hypothetical protein
MALAVLAIGTSAQQPTQNPEIGTWKLNVEKSTYSPGPAPKSSTITMTPVGNGVKYVQKTVNAEGKESTVEYTANYDGMDVAHTGSDISDTSVVRRIDANTVERVTKKGGKVMGTFRRQYSQDGKSLTMTLKSPWGWVNNTEVYEKQM